MGCCSVKEGTGADTTAPKVFFPKRDPAGLSKPVVCPPNVDRSTTDKNFACCFFVVLLYMVVMVAFSFWQGKYWDLTQMAYWRLARGFDTSGNLCGADASVLDKEFLFYCGSKATKDVDGKAWPSSLNFKSKACVQACPKNFSTPVPCLSEATFNVDSAANNTVGGIKYDITYLVEIQQTIETGISYPSSPMGRTCLPDEVGLKESLLYNGPPAHKDRVYKAVASLSNGWPILFVPAVLAILIGFLYLHLMGVMAGVFIYITILVAMVLMIILGFFFLIAIFFNGEDLANAYTRTNPIMHSYVGFDGRISSFFFGIFLLLLAYFLWICAKNTRDSVDKSMGIIAAAHDCVTSTWQMRLQALLKSLWIIFQIFLCFFTLAMICTIGYIDKTTMYIDGEAVEGLVGTFKWYKGWSFLVGLYVFFSWWLCEVSIARYQFSITYAVCQWYFVPAANVPLTEEDKKSMTKGEHVNVRVGGVDNVAGDRAGIKVKDASGQEVLVVPVGARGPGTVDLLSKLPMEVQFSGLNTATKSVKIMPPNAVHGGTCQGLRCHIGSFAYAACVVPIYRVFRLIAVAIGAVFGRSEKRGSIDEEDNSLWAAFENMGNFISGSINMSMGSWGKDAYEDMVLTSNDFKTCAESVGEVLEEAGSVVSLMYGTLAIFEPIAVLTVTALCTFVTNIILTNATVFTDPTNPRWYVEDTLDLTYVAAMISGVITYAFFSLHNITVDTMLYTFAWSRRMMVNEAISVMPPTLKAMLGPEVRGDPETLGILKPTGHRISPYGHHQFLHAAQHLHSTMMEKRPLLSTAFGTRA
eukprot:TRINITY_DN5765_c0_g1_i2.p1 TRINITY_DN5765_c0_g1~~TRINITY_DN5765_c0_g1_i2.p1  ORF type:complete len:809 (-),score=138.55 TRINITY_DN5765_c0_g1_i2:277-2703(-)